MRFVAKLVMAAVLAAVVAVPAPAGMFEHVRRSVDYSPSSTLVAHGALQIGSFSYLPAVNGKVKPYQQQNRALNDLYWDTDVSVYFRESLLKELRFIGFKVDRGPLLSGEIKQFQLDDLGDLTTTLVVHYVLKDESGAVLYDAEKTVNTRESALQLSFEQLVRDPAFLKAVDPKGETVQPLPPARAPAANPVTSLPAVYAPSLPFILGGSISMGAFDYPPSAGGKVDADQIRNTAVNNIHLTAPVANYVKDALFSELRLSGVDIASKDRVLSASVLEFSCDDLGFTADWKLDVKYTVRDKSGAVLYEDVKRTKFHSDKSPWFAGRVLHNHLEALLLDEAFLKAIGSPPDAGGARKPANPSPAFDVAPSDAAPSSALIAHGAVSVGAFTYPQGAGKVAQDQVAKPSGSGFWSFERPVAEMMHNRLINELRFTGIDVREHSRVITGEVQKYTVDNGEPSDWSITVRFVVKDQAGVVLYDAVKTGSHKTTRNTIDFGEMKAVIEALISDPAFIKAIN